MGIGTPWQMASQKQNINESNSRPQRTLYTQMALPALPQMAHTFIAVDDIFFFFKAHTAVSFASTVSSIGCIQLMKRLKNGVQ